VSKTTELSREAGDVAESLARAVLRSGRMVSVAESMTCGLVSAHLGAAHAAGEWFNGAVIAYTSEVKSKVLGVDPGPVITASCARQMARGVAELTGSDLAAAVTGVGGPGPTEGRAAGTAYIAVWAAGVDRVEEHHFDGEPEEVVRACVLQVLKALLAQAG
jgi:nicotinamide-nucleotide amidase